MSQQKQQQPSRNNKSIFSQQLPLIAPKQSHQFKALFYKNTSLQWKQPCTNICQILTPIICLIFTIMIRNVAISNLPTNQNSIYNQVPVLPFKLNDFQIMNKLIEIVFSFDCSRWLLVGVQKQQDKLFIGKRNGKDNKYGMLSNVPETNQGYYCWLNQSFQQPFYYTYRKDIPYFLQPNISINNDIFQRYLKFNQMTIDNIRHTNAAQKMPDGAVYFYQANNKSLYFDLKVNDQRMFQLHNRNGLTKISIRDPLKLNSSWQTYYTIPQGQLQLLDMITLSYFKTLTNKTFASGYIYMPLSSGSSGFIQALINIVATIIFPLSLSLLLPVFLYNIVLQKQTKIIQMMRMNGLSIMTYWGVNFMFNVIISLLTYMVFYGFGRFYMESTFFVNTSGLLLWVVLIGWMLCQIGMSMLFQVFISNSRAANIIGYLITIWTNLIGATLSVAMYQYPVQMPFFTSLWPTISFNRLFYLMFINCSADHCYDSFQALPNQAIRCIYIIYISAILFILLGMYLFEVVPQEFGIAKSVLFPFQCLRKKKSYQEIHQQSNKIEEINQNYMKKQVDQMAIQQNNKVKVNKFTDYAMVCDRLTKVYDNGKQATTDFSLILQDNQVFGLLGPNGAGKTTLISMITGIFSPSSGTAYVSGYNIQTSIDSVHMNMGVCPQFDILWDQLSVQQHLYFYARLRGTPTSLQQSKVQQILQQVSLKEFSTFKVKQLSGGMKRRLSVAISLVGDPRVVFLDQPTTGLDPQNRRNLWELLAKCKNKRSLFLTTHLMDQAESLCDRIGIITNGRLRTVGDQMTLKKKYGNGYCLTISLQIQRQQYHQIRSSYYQSINKVIQQQQQYRQSSQSSQKSRVSVMSVNQQPSHYNRQANYLVNDSIGSSNYQFNLSNKKINDSRMRRQDSSSQYYVDQQENQEYNDINIGYEGKIYTQKHLQQLNKYILQRFSSQQFKSSSSSNISISYQPIQSPLLQQQSSSHPQTPFIIKQLNGTVHFNLGHQIKISKVLQQLNRMKHMTFDQIVNYQHNNKKKKNEVENIKIMMNINKEKENKEFIEFQWSINNSSLQDVFIEVVKKYQNHKIQQLQTSIQEEIK